MNKIIRIIMALAAFYLVSVFGTPSLQAGTPPVIKNQPESVNAEAGHDATFQVEVTDHNKTSFQWYFNDAPLSGQIYDAMSIKGVTAAQAGRYSVQVSNAYGAVMSREATLQVEGAPVPGLLRRCRSLRCNPSVRPWHRERR